MSHDHSTRLQDLLERACQGDEGARRELLDAAYDRLLLLTRHILRRDFNYLHHRHNTQSVLHEALVRLLKVPAEKARWPTALDFFRYSAVLIRRTLVDMLRYHRRRPAGAALEPATGSTVLPYEAADDTGDPAVVAMWTEFHSKVEELPDEERAVVDLHWYHGLSQAETARLLGVHEKAVSRRWLSARLKLAEWVPGWEQLVPGRG